MWLIRAALRRPITVLMLVLGAGMTSTLALQRMRADILPNLGTPILYVAQAYGGMDPAQMEGYLVNYYEFHFLYINGIDRVESKSIQDVGLVTLYFHPGTDMAQALAETVAQVNRARAFMPPGTVPPVVLRQDAGSMPVGYVTFSSDTRSLNEIQDLALFRVRPMFGTLPGVSGRPPFGGNQRTIVINVDPNRLRAYGLSADEVIQAVAKNNVIVPSGYVRVGDQAKAAPINAVVRNIDELLEIPLRPGAGATVFLRDIGTVQDTMDILAGYALVDGQRSVYLPVIKRADASTLDVVNEVRNALPQMRALVPEDITVDFEFDQSRYVTSAIRSLTTEGILGALLTGLAVLFFLRDIRGALIVVATIPLALLAAVVGLWVTGQTINIMTLGGLTLAIGILVDESTVAIENMHTHLARQRNKALAILNAGAEVAIPQFLAMLCVAAVFTPALFMVGPGKALFVPLALAVAFAMAASYFLARTFVPVMATWLLRASPHDTASQKRVSFDRVRERYGRVVNRLVGLRWAVVAIYLVGAMGVVYVLGTTIGTEIFPRIDTGQLQMRIKAPAGTRVERTEVIAQNILQFLSEEAGRENVQGSIGYVGIQPTSYPINTILLWTSGPHEAVLRVALKPDAGVSTEVLKERLRGKLTELAPGTTIAFEPADIISQVMSFGASTPIEVSVSGADFAASRKYAKHLRQKVADISTLRDVQFAQLLASPSLNIQVDRERAGQLGVTVEDVGRALVAATSSTRFIQPLYWAAPNGVSYQVQIEIPQSLTNSIESVETIPVSHDGTLYPLVGDVATIAEGTSIGQYDRINQQRMLTITADVKDVDLGTAAEEVRSAIRAAGDPPRGVSVTMRGQVAPMQQTLDGLQTGLILAIGAIFILLGAYFQSLRIAVVVIATIPAVVAGVLIALAIAGDTLNVQSFMGAIVSIGVAVANAILLTTFAEQSRMAGASAVDAAIAGAQSRLRPILMTTSAMVLGMVPLALGAAQTAPLGRAVIGGLIAATIATLFVLPSSFALVQSRAGRRSPSLDPHDAASPFYSSGSQEGM